MTLYMLDTNMVSYLIRQHPGVVRRVYEVPMSRICASSITAGELYFGLARLPVTNRLHTAVRELLVRIAILPWDNEAAERYGIVKADLQRQGRLIGPFDLLIAAHALRVDAVLVTSDRAFRQVPGLILEDWTI